MKRPFLVIVLTILIIPFSSQVFGENDLDVILEQENGVQIEQQKIIFEIGKRGDVHVKHLIETGKWNSDRPRILEILPGSHSNLNIVDEDGDLLTHSFDGETFEESRYIILEQKLGNYDLIAEYDLEKYVEFKEGVWKTQINFPHDIIIMLDDNVELVFANSRPVPVNDTKGINCVGCSLHLEFFDNENFLKKEILIGDSKFDIEILAEGNVSDLNYFQDAKMIRFSADEVNKLFAMKIPLGLLLNPFDVYLTDENDQDLDQTDKIRKTEYNQDDTHVNLSFRTLHSPSIEISNPVISIIGATLEEHEKKLQQIKKIKEREVQAVIPEEKKSGIALPKPGEMIKPQDEVVQGNEAKLSFEEELKNDQVLNVEDNSIVFGIIAGIIGAIVIAVIIKIKKN